MTTWPRWPRDYKLTAAAAVAAAASSGALLLIPVYGATTNGAPEHSESLLEYEGAHVLIALAIPILVAAAPLLVGRPHRRAVLIITATIATMFVLVAGFTIGMFYAPSAILLVLAARAARAECRAQGLIAGQSE